MSRTYRLRHLPRFNSQKYVNAGMHKTSSRYYNECLELAEKITGNNYMLTFSVARQLDKNLQRPVESLVGHPYIGLGLAALSSRLKKGCRKEGRRCYRQHEHRVTKDLERYGDQSTATYLPIRWFTEGAWELW